MKNNLAEIKKNYGTLITTYVNVLNETPQNKSMFIGQRFLSKLFIESYIKSNLTELSISLRYFNEKIKSKNGFKSRSNWINERIVDCRELSSTLIYWQSIKNIIIPFIPLLIGLITARLGIETIYQIINLNYSEFFLLITFPYVGFLFLSLGFGFSAKQSILKKYNLYQMERSLFNLLGRQLRNEYPLDLIFEWTGYMVSFLSLLYASNVLMLNDTSVKCIQTYCLVFIILESISILIRYRIRIKEQKQNK